MSWSLNKVFLKKNLFDFLEVLNMDFKFIGSRCDQPYTMQMQPIRSIFRCEHSTNNQNEHCNPRKTVRIDKSNIYLWIFGDYCSVELYSHTVLIS